MCGIRIELFRTGIDADFPTNNFRSGNGDEALDRREVVTIGLEWNRFF